MNENNPESDPSRSACAEAIASLQEHMDRNASEVTPAVAEHRETCPVCRDEWQLARLLMRRPAKPVIVPASLLVETERLVHRDRTRQRNQRWGKWALIPTAAVVLVAVFWPRQPELPSGGESLTIAVAAVSTQAENHHTPTLDESFSEARSAVASLSGRVVPERPEVTITLPKVEPVAEVEPAWDRLADAGDGLKTGVKPLTTSARRAVNMLFKATETLTFADTSPKNRP